MSKSFSDLLEMVKGFSQKEKKHPSPQQREATTDLLVALCELAVKPAKKKGKE